MNSKPILPDIPDHYASLELPGLASAAEVKEAYLRIQDVYKIHLRIACRIPPSERPGAVEDAYRVLGNAKSKIRYDATYPMVRELWNEYEVELAARNRREEQCKDRNALFRKHKENREQRQARNDIEQRLLRQEWEEKQAQRKQKTSADDDDQESLERSAQAQQYQRTSNVPLPDGVSESKQLCGAGTKRKAAGGNGEDVSRKRQSHDRLQQSRWDSPQESRQLNTRTDAHEKSGRKETYDTKKDSRRDLSNVATGPQHSRPKSRQRDRYLEPDSYRPRYDRPPRIHIPPSLSSARGATLPSWKKPARPRSTSPLLSDSFALRKIPANITSSFRASHIYNRIKSEPQQSRTPSRTPSKPTPLPKPAITLEPSPPQNPSSLPLPLPPHIHPTRPAYDPSPQIRRHIAKLHTQHIHTIHLASIGGPAHEHLLINQIIELGWTHVNKVGECEECKRVHSTKKWGMWVCPEGGMRMCRGCLNAWGTWGRFAA